MASHQETDTMRGEHGGASSTGGEGGSGILRSYTQEEAKVSLPETDGSDFKTMVAESASMSKLEDEQHLTSSSGNDKRNESRSNDNKSQQKKVRRTKEEDYDSVLSSFDDYAAGKGKGEGASVAHGYEVGDMVWGKVKSHPWWPGHIYDESLASPSVRRSKGEGHVLVAFFGDSSYGWFDPAELIPFEENFDEKSRQTPSRSFVIAVEEAVDELSRRRSVGLVCRCRNQFNFWPSGVEGHLVVDVGDYEPGSYSLRQIRDAHDSFQPKEMVSFIQQLALTPMDDQHKTIRFMKNKATVLACRKSLYEEFDETYAQAFGTVPVRPPRPTAPVSVDPSKAPLTGRLVIAETLGKGKVFAKPIKTKEQLEKDKYLFKRRDEPSRVKPKKALGSPSHSLFLDGSGLSGRVTYSGQAHKSSEAGVTDYEQQNTSPHPPIVVEGGSKKAKAKRPVGELSSENAGLFEKKKKNKKLKREISTDLPQAPVSGSSTAKMESVSRKPVQVPLVDNNIPVYVVEKSLSSPMETQPDVKAGKFELADLVRDLRSLALDPFYGMHRGCAAIAQRVFWKYRSLVYKKSLIPTPPADNEASEAGKLPATFTIAERASEKSALKPVRPLGRPDDPTKGGRKRGPLDHVEGIKKKKKINDEEVKNKKKLARLESDEIVKTKPKEAEYVRLKKKSSDSEDTKKRKIDDSKTSAGEKKNVQPTLPKSSKPESGKRVPNPTMLVMRFPSDAGLPSGAELRAKFTRFGPLDHSATRIFWTTHQCRLVYHYKADAEAALKFCNGSSVLFGNSNVKCHIRELAAEGTDTEPNKGPKEEASSQPTLRISDQSQQSKVQLKSCLKKPVGDETGNGNGRGGSRVKFALGGEESSNRSEPVTEGGSVSYSTMDAVSKNLPSSVPQPNIASAPPPVQFPHFAGNMPFDHRQRSFNPPPFPQMPVAPQAPNDISQQMLNLLMRCSHVVNNVRGFLGYMPYHPL